jgi:hypothetical protein
MLDFAGSELNLKSAVAQEREALQAVRFADYCAAGIRAALARALPAWRYAGPTPSGRRNPDARRAASRVGSGTPCSLKHALLGFLNYGPHTGYELKKVFDIPSPTSGAPNSQIYPT